MLVLCRPRFSLRSLALQAAERSGLLARVPPLTSLPPQARLVGPTAAEVRVVPLAPTTTHNHSRTHTHTHTRSHTHTAGAGPHSDPFPQPGRPASG